MQAVPVIEAREWVAYDADMLVWCKRWYCGKIKACWMVCAGAAACRYHRCIVPRRLVSVVCTRRVRRDAITLSKGGRLSGS